MLAIHRILYPTDYSEQSRPAFALACSLARDFGASLVVCHVAPPPVAGVVDGVIIDQPADEMDQLRDQLEKIVPDDPQIEVAHRLEQGDAVREIVRVAGEERADLIVMATHGRGGVSRLLMGSVAEGVMRKAPCPVLTVRPGASAPVDQSLEQELVHAY